MYQSKLPADPTSLIFGIISLVIVFLGCCCGPLVIVSLGLSVTGLIMASKSLKEFDQNREAYTIETQNNVTWGKIICIVATVVNAIFVVIMLVTLLFYGKLFSDVLQETYKNKKTNQYTVQDTIDKNNRDIEIDTVIADTIRIDTTNKK